MQLPHMAPIDSQQPTSTPSRFAARLLMVCTPCRSIQDLLLLTLVKSFVLEQLVAASVQAKQHDGDDVAANHKQVRASVTGAPSPPPCHPTHSRVIGFGD